MNAHEYTLISDSDDAELAPAVESRDAGGGEEEVARVHIYRESGPMILRPLSTPTMGGPRPSQLPSAIDVFLWGGLSVGVLEAILPPLQRHLRTTMLCFACGYILAIAPLVAVLKITGSTTLSSLWAGLYALHAALCLAATVKAVQLSTHSVVLALHRELEIAVSATSPSFRCAGYDLQYGTQKTGRFSLDAFIRIVRYVPSSEVWMANTEPRDNGEASPGAAASESNRQRRRSSPPHSSSAHGSGSTSLPLNPSSVSRRDDFRVAVFGLQSSPLLPGCPRKEYDFISVRCPELRVWVDPLTWGAVAMEMRPFAVRYAKARTPAIFVFTIVAPLVIWTQPLIPVSYAWSSWGYYPVIASFAALVVLAGPTFERVVPERLLGHHMFQELHDATCEKIRELSPLVAERSGYELSYEVESDGCGCRSGYVRFRDVSRGDGRSAVASEGITPPTPLAAA